MPQSTQTQTGDLHKIALIKSVTGHSEGRETQVLEQVRRILDGATITDLMDEAGER